MPQDQEISFSVKLDTEEWNRYRRGWRCSAMRIPGANIDGVYTEDGTEIPKGVWNPDKNEHLIIWSKEMIQKKPQSVLVLFKITEALSTRREVISTQAEAASAQRNRDKWKKLAVLAAFLTPLIGFGSAVITSQSPPIVDLLSRLMKTDRHLQSSSSKAKANHPKLPPIPDPEKTLIPSPRGASDDLTVLGEEEAMALVKDWLEIKAEILAAPFDDENDEKLLAKVAHTEGDLYKSLTGGDGKIAVLKAANASIEYDYSRAVQNWGPPSSDTEPKFVVQVEESFEYRSPRGVTLNESDAPSNFTYEFKREGNEWKIYEYTKRDG